MAWVRMVTWITKGNSEHEDGSPSTYLNLDQNDKIIHVYISVRSYTGSNSTISII